MKFIAEDVIRTLRDNIQQIGHFYTAGNPGRNDLDDTQELMPKGDSLAGLKQAYKVCEVWVRFTT